MLWRRPPQPLSIPPVAPVPDAEALRRAALEASWRRDRWVARRRVWLRWLLWVSGRYLMPALLVFGIGAWLWLGLLPGLVSPMDPPALTGTPAANTTPVVTAPVVVDPPAPGAEPALTMFSPEGEELPLPLALRFEPRWAAAASIGSLSDPAAGATETSTITPPNLKPENWLHSKEP
jgi:hypothetical protein